MLLCRRPLGCVALAFQRRHATAGVADWLDDTKPQADQAAGNVDTSPHAIKRSLVLALMEKDRQVLELKRIHELSLQRVENHHKRAIQQHEEKAVYFEDNINKLTLETVEVTEHEFRGVKRHRDMAANVRWLVCAGNIVGTVFCLRWMWKYYAEDPRRVYVKVWTRIYGSDKDYRHEFQQMLRNRQVPALGAGMAKGGEQ